MSRDMSRDMRVALALPSQAPECIRRPIDLQPHHIARQALFPIRCIWGKFLYESEGKRMRACCMPD